MDFLCHNDEAQKRMHLVGQYLPMAVLKKIKVIHELIKVSLFCAKAADLVAESSSFFVFLANTNAQWKPQVFGKKTKQTKAKKRKNRGYQPYNNRRHGVK